MHLSYGVVCPTLVGREREFDAGRAVLGRAQAGAGEVALIVGEAGVGKSRLLRALLEDARSRGFFVLRGASFEADTPIPFAPLLDLVRLFAESASPALVAHVLEPAASDLVTLFPELRSILPDATPGRTVDPELGRRRLFHSLAHAVSRIAHTQPVVLAFEDVHWSDDATLELIFHLARSEASHPVAVVLTRRPDEGGLRLAQLVAELERARVLTEIPVRALGRDAIHEMVRAIFGAEAGLGADFVDMLHGLTEGNPFFVEETLKALIVAGDLTQRDGRWRAQSLERVRVPRTAVDAVRRRLATLTVPARTLASTASVAGRRFDFELLQAVTGAEERELLTLIKELIGAQLVVEESAERFAFRHAITREAIYVDLLARERIALHREIAAALERSADEAVDRIVESLAYHTWEAGDWAAAARYSARAAQHAMALSAPREAVGHLDRAFMASQRAGVQVGIDLRLARGRAHETLAEFDGALEDFTAALEQARAAGDERATWESLHALGMLWAARDYVRAGRFRRDALATARTIGDDSLVARSLNRVGNWHVNVEEPQAGLPHHEEALAIFERLGHHEGVAETVDLLGMAHHIAGDQRAAALHYERSVALFTETDDRRGLCNALGLLALCGSSYHSSSTTPFASAAVHAELASPRSIQLACEIGWRAGEAFVRFLIADCLAWRGEYDRAIPLAHEALELAEQIGHLEWAAGARRLLGAVALDLGAPVAARAHLEAAHTSAQALGSLVWVRWTAAPLALARHLTGDPAGAKEALDHAARSRPEGESRAAAAAGDALLTLGERQLWMSRAELALLGGRPAEALAIADARLAQERAANPESRLGVPRLSLMRGRALHALGEYDDALAALDASRSQAEAQGARPLMSMIESAAGHAHRALRQRLAARQAFDRAQAIGAELAATIPDESLRASFLDRLASIVPAAPPPSPARRARDAAGGLTRRERDVVRLVARGKANKVIAHDLGIGERTVEGYVASALAKLGFDSRTQLATWAVANGIVSGASARAPGRE
jgi:DNA-binding CsgD family transcriptional regulator/tetratricopeptide (TPR) repeat protein/ABC-type cobalamin/Fe3+-siderophores transport system ATPase subunit